MSEKNKAIVRELFDRTDREGRIPAELCDPGFIAHIPGSPPMDLKTFEQFRVPFATAFSDWKNTDEDIVAEGDKVAFRFERQATHTGEFMGIPASGKQISWTTIGIAQLAGGKIVEFWNSPDRMGMMQQVGVIPKQD